MDQPNNTSVIKLKQFRRCNECSKYIDEIQQICRLCVRAKTIPLSGNEEVDWFIRYTLTNNDGRGKMEFAPYDNFRDVSFIAEGGFSKIYKATWIDGPITNWNEGKQKYNREGNRTVALKELNN